MTEKRFKEIISIETIVDEETGLHHKPVMLTDDFLELINELNDENKQLKSENIDLRKDLGEFEKSINIQGLIGENEQLKHQNELLSDELEQCKAVINNRWSEYLKKKGVEDE